ncbi:MAG: bifunctional DNA-formamidopyrimidine glycosylase/DNA-(apurinic or apyrimidinic site) lyase [Candidatus Pelagibacter sp.]|jgi:formamidopyrimidine-DNA glycosylase|nr:bifunctional DNA-formamidopyrimidine glycosylase/DNA-(apurinic or apyrimidinic site) lyase [Candidatus Pelagibacter sp.]MBT3693213.1 bifunctional DNA-formamidopyrimidine glycosylase/DNA-(apurinic or apyrimidinic site) lyase [Candidatus Pelagibacter sp.]MDB2527160.1 bifunctional DNA-formamidopyrimidine glycosylase/DNA-(apurinic or apyrimidinic site) lyase [Candidatus Pelagibacter bacterium]|tara:strand:+ start:2847 stop:3710 length:864 start_codon:yes stop_codon:yes gene_type:complete
MPELPEVEIVKQSLSQNIQQKKIQKVIIKNRNLRFKIPSKFEQLLKNKFIVKVSRFSKYLIFNFSDRSFCLVHLGMSGTIHLIKKNNLNNFTNTSFYNSSNLPKKHNHVEIRLKNLKIIYNDPRRFGFFRYIKNEQELKKKFEHLGPEPFFKEFNLKYLMNYFKNKKKDIKSFLLDQKFVSGIGNIYASEILFLCKINPKKEAFKLTKKEGKKIISFSKIVLNKAIKKGGSSIRDFKNILGENGNYQKEFKVYQKESGNCPRNKCKGKIKKIVVAKRSTFYCNICQK